MIDIGVPVGFVAKMALWKQAILVVVLVVGVAAGWYVFEYPQTLGLGGSDEGVASAGRGSAGNSGGRIPGLIGGGAVNVVTAPVETDEMGDALSALGTAKAARSVTLYPESLRNGRGSPRGGGAERGTPAISSSGFRMRRKRSRSRRPRSRLSRRRRCLSARKP